MAEIDLCLSKAFNYSNLVQQNTQKRYQHHNYAHYMLCFTPFFSEDRNQDVDTTATHRKLIIELLKQQNIVFKFE